MRPTTSGPRKPSVTKLMIDSLREVSVLVLVFGFLDEVRGIEALAFATAGLLGAVVLARRRH